MDFVSRFICRWSASFPLMSRLGAQRCPFTAAVRNYLMHALGYSMTSRGQRVRRLEFAGIFPLFF